jgi:hypothetical protein
LKREIGLTVVRMDDPTIWPALLMPFAEVPLFAEGSSRVVTV